MPVTGYGLWAAGGGQLRSRHGFHGCSRIDPCDPSDQWLPEFVGRSPAPGARSLGGNCRSPPGICATMSLRARRLATAALGTLGTLDAFYMLMYDEGLIEHLVCPFFGEGCEIVGRSKHAKHFGVPNAVVGALGYTGMAALALWAGDKASKQRPLQPLAQAALASVFAGTSAF